MCQLTQCKKKRATAICTTVKKNNNNKTTALHKLTFLKPINLYKLFLNSNYIDVSHFENFLFPFKNKHPTS
jgi:hypothetical protein